MAVTVKMLLGAPELAILDALEATLDASIEALSAAYPDLERIDLFVATEPTSTAACLADAIASQAQVLSRMLHNYRALIALQPEWERAAPAEPYPHS
jgi:hypothetical protein